MNYELREKEEDMSTNNSQFAIRNSLLFSAIRNSQLSRGFTLLEVMVASLLLAMLVTILTMIFNQSSIAWTTGTASVAGLGDVRRDMAVVGQQADNLLEAEGARPGLQVVTIWDQNGNGIRTDTQGRSVDRNGLIGKDKAMRDPYQSETIAVGSASTAGKDSYIVGVTSWGPDRQTGGDHTWDDITTMPEEAD